MFDLASRMPAGHKTSSFGHGPNPRILILKVVRDELKIYWTEEGELEGGIETTNHAQRKMYFR